MCEDEVPRLPQNVLFEVPELLGMISVITWYLAALPSLPSFAERERRILILEKMKAQFQEEFLAATSEICVPLSAEEIATLLEAVMGFVEHLQQRLLEREERDRVLGIVHSWRLHLMNMIAEEGVGRE